MEMEEIQTQGCSKFARISNGNGKMQNLDEEDDGGGGEGGGSGGGRGSGGGGGLNISSSHGVGSLCGWPSSRIVRVSRASGGKDRHSKVLTSKGLRDRRVRLSVNTAIQFYDLQDRLGYDQPSKAVEWLLKAAAPSIAELPSLNPPFAAADSQQLSDSAAAAGIEQPPLDSTAAAEIELEADQNFQQRSLSLSKSCSSTSETSKGSGGLSLSRSESRIKARERARERAAKDKEKENDGGASHHHQNLNPISSSFTELLTGTTSPSPNSSVHQTRGENTNFFAKSPRNWDYFTSAAYSGNMNLTNPLHHHHHQHFSELQQFSFVSDHLAPVVTAAPPGNNNNHHYHHHNLNFSISPSSGFNNNRGTLQSNSSSSSSPSSLLPHFQRFDGSSSSPSFFTISTAPPNANAVENHHNFLPGFDARLQLYYGDPHAAAHRHSDHKGKDKS